MKGISSPPTTDFNKLLSDTVFNDSLAAAETWQDLDLSAYVGSQSAICYLECSCDTVDVNQFAAKPKGYGGLAENHLDAEHCSTCRINPAAASGIQGYIIVVTDDAGKIQIASSDETIVWTIKLVGLIK